MTTPAVESDPLAKRLSACNGTYQRDPDGTWRYFWGEPVPAAADVRDGGRIVGMLAPELCPELLADAAAVVAHLGWAGGAGTLSTYLARGRFPRPVVRVGQCGAWTWPVIRYWERSRPWRDGHPVGVTPA